MSVRSVTLRVTSHDGTSQRGRALSALDPGYVAVDERTTGDLLGFVQAFARRLRYLAPDDATGELRDAGDWSALVERPDITIADIVAYIAEPERFTGERARWLGRPHFALLLVFLELFRHTRQQLGELTGRHLDYFYRDILQMQREPALPDRAAVVLRLAARVSEARIPAGTALQAGHDSAGRPRVYRTERELLVGRAQVAALRSLFAYRRVTGIPDVRRDRSLTAPEVLGGMLRIALGAPRPGDPVPAFEDARIDAQFLSGLEALLAFVRGGLSLEHHELRELMLRVRRLQADGASGAAAGADKVRIDAEWAAVNQLLERAGRRQRGEPAWNFSPADPTAFAANLAKALAGHWPPPWPPGTKTPGIQSIYDYDAKLRALEKHLSMPAEQLEQMVTFAQALPGHRAAEITGWSEIDRILTSAHRERIYAARRAKLAEIRAGRNDLAGMDAITAFVLGKRPDETVDWDKTARPILEQYLKAQLGSLELFRQQLAARQIAPWLGWDDVYRMLELVQRYVEQLAEPVAQKLAWRNLYAYADATLQRVAAATSPRWRTFGGVDSAADEHHPPAPTFGWGLRSPVLALSEGTRTLELTLGFLAESFDPDGLAATGVELADALAVDWRIEVSTAKGWVELAIVEARLARGKPGDDYWSLLHEKRQLDEDRPALQLVLRADVTVDALAPEAGADQPGLRVLLRPRWDELATEWTTPLARFESLVLAAVRLRVTVDGLSALALQHDDRVLDPRKPFEPFGVRPAVGARLFIGHPELIQGRLDRLRFDVEWMGLPPSLAAHYANYPQDLAQGAASFRVRIALVDRNLELALTDAPLFEDGEDKSKSTRPTASVTIADVPAALAAASPGFAYARRPASSATSDLRTAGRYLRWELSPHDFGHSIHAALVAAKARELAIDLGTGKVAADSQAAYGVQAPYTPTIKRLSVAYEASIELDPRAPHDSDRLLHVHPFGEARIDPLAPRLMPPYDQSGELYIGLGDLDPPRRITLLFQLAEGTSDPDAPPAVVSWSCLDGDRWRDLGDGGVLHDSTRGLRTSGVVELALPEVAASAWLPRGLYWLRVAIAGDPASVCDAVDIRAQATFARFDDQGNAADHYRQPLPPGSIDRLLTPDARIFAIEQPFSSFGGTPPETPELFNTRVSERLRHKQRALTAWDYERLVLQRFGQVYKAKCLPAAVTEELGQVDVIVIPDIRDALPSDAFAPRVSADLLADMQAYLRERAPAAAQVRVRNAEYVPVLVRVGVRFVPGVDPGFAKKQLDDDLIRFLSPWAYDPVAEVTIGGSIYATSIVAFVDGRDYVDHVAEIKLFRGVGEDAFELIAPASNYRVSTERADQVLVSAPRHHIDVLSELDHEQTFFTGLNYMKLELDFIVG